MSKLVPAGQAWLTSVDAAVAVLAQIERVEDAVDLLGAAETAKKYARNVLRSREAQNHAAHVALLCQRRAGELLERLNLNGGDRKSESHDDRVKLGDLGVDANQSSRWQRVAAIPEEAFEAAVDEITSRGDELTTAGLIREATGAHVGHNSGDNEWYTPEPYIAAARDVLGEIDLDPASTETANAVVGAHTFITEQQNGLSKKWRGTVLLLFGCACCNDPHAVKNMGTGELHDWRAHTKPERRRELKLLIDKSMGVAQ